MTTPATTSIDHQEIYPTSSAPSSELFDSAGFPPEVLKAVQDTNELLKDRPIKSLSDKVEVLKDPRIREKLQEIWSKVSLDEVMVSSLIIASGVPADATAVGQNAMLAAGLTGSAAALIGTASGGFYVALGLTAFYAGVKEINESRKVEDHEGLWMGSLTSLMGISLATGGVSSILSGVGALSGAAGVSSAGAAMSPYTTLALSVFAGIYGAYGVGIAEEFREEFNEKTHIQKNEEMTREDALEELEFLTEGVHRDEALSLLENRLRVSNDEALEIFTQAQKLQTVLETGTEEEINQALSDVREISCELQKIGAASPQNVKRAIGILEYLQDKVGANDQGNEQVKKLAEFKRRVGEDASKEIINNAPKLIETLQDENSTEEEKLTALKAVDKIVQLVRKENFRKFVLYGLYITAALVGAAAVITMLTVGGPTPLILVAICWGMWFAIDSTVTPVLLADTLWYLIREMEKMQDRQDDKSLDMEIIKKMVAFQRQLERERARQNLSESPLVQEPSDNQ